MSATTKVSFIPIWEKVFTFLLLSEEDERRGSCIAGIEILGKMKPRYKNV